MFRFNFSLDKIQRTELFILFVILLNLIAFVFVVAESYSLIDRAETQINRLVAIDAQLDKVEHKLDKAIETISTHE